MMLVGNKQSVAPSRPNSFVGMMELYENNYIKIRQLCGDLNVISEYSLAHVEGKYDLALQLLERSPYTLSIKFSYPGGYHNEGIDLPAFFVRVYFDALQAEARGPADRVHYPTGTIERNPSRSSICQRWSDNLLLFKWLEYWSRAGYSFDRSLTKN